VAALKPKKEKPFTCELFPSESDVRKVEKQRLNALLFDEAQARYSEIAGPLAADTLRVAHQDQNRGIRVTKAH